MHPKENSDLLAGARFELCYAISALNMCPDPIPSDAQIPDNNGYLSETDCWAEHAVEHMRAAMECLNIVENQQFTSVRLLTQMLSDGRIRDCDVFNLLHDLKDNNLSPGEERDLHLRYLKFKHEMEQSDE